MFSLCTEASTPPRQPESKNKKTKAEAVVLDLADEVGAELLFRNRCNNELLNIAQLAKPSHIGATRRLKMHDTITTTLHHPQVDGLGWRDELAQTEQPGPCRAKMPNKPQVS